MASKVAAHWLVIVNQDHKEQAQKQHTPNARACMHT